MGRRRLPLFLIVLAIALVVVVSSRGPALAQRDSARDFVMGVGLPGIDRGVNSDDPRASGNADGIRRRDIQSRAPAPDRIGADRGRIIAGKLIVKFRDGVASGD